MELTRADTGACTVLHVSGSIGSFDAARLRTALAKTMVEGLRCIVCDLSAVTWLDPVCVAVWVSAQWSGPWPGPVVWLVGANGQPADALRVTGAGRFLHIAESLQAAVAQQLSAPPLRRERLLLAPAPSAPGQARRFTTEVLALWAVSELTEEATLVVSELVTNGVQHAGSDLELRLEHGRGLLHIAVRDGGRSSALVPQTDPEPPAREAGVADIHERGHGLDIVQAFATASGQTRAPGGGSLYWATLRDVNHVSRHGLA